MIINIISSSKGGGAELLVRELHKVYLKKNLDAHAIYLNGSKSELRKNEIVLGANPRSPLNIFRIRRILKMRLRQATEGLTVHVHLTWPLLYVTFACFGLSNVNLIYTEHNTTNKRRSIPFIRRLERMLYSRYKRIICISEGVNKSLANWVGTELSERLVIVPNGSRIYRLAKRSSLEGRLPRLVSIGSLSPKKNFDTAIRAVAKLKDKIESYIIIGEGQERTYLENIIKEERLQDKVFLIGWSEDIEKYLHEADVQLIPSRWEGFGLVAVEGMSTGLPVVASNVDGLREVLDPKNPSVTLVDESESISAWVTAINVSISKIEERGSATLANFSRAQAEQFTLEGMANNYVQVYNEH